jgi:DNA polymerase IV
MLANNGLPEFLDSTWTCSPRRMGSSTPERRIRSTLRPLKPPRQILHVDMDAFFASVEQHDSPALRGKPVVVGGHGRRAVVCAASYEARPFGVHSAMPMGEALRRCPQAVVVLPRRARYEEVSAQVFALFRQYTPLVEGLSLDEAFLDVTSSQSLFGSGRAIAEALRAAIERETGLTASAGVAHSKFAAKIASDMNKPNGITCVPDDVAMFLRPLPIRRMWGIGPKQEPRFLALGLRTFRDLQKAERSWLLRALGPEGARYQDLALGIDAREVIANADPKSIGAERTYEIDLQGREAVARCILEHAERVSRRLLESNLQATCVTLKLKYADFTLVSRRMTAREPISDTQSIYASCASLLAAMNLEGARIRLVGVSVSHFSAQGVQVTLFPDPAQRKREALEQALQAVHRKTGNPLTRATLLGGRE